MFPCWSLIGGSVSAAYIFQLSYITTRLSNITTVCEGVGLARRGRKVHGYILLRAGQEKPSETILEGVGGINIEGQGFSRRFIGYMLPFCLCECVELAGRGRRGGGT